MKVLAIADEESRYLWDFFQPEKLKDIDLILSCGDLKAQYLDFLATFTHAPILYVHGNHDERYKKKPPDSCNCICVEDKIYNYCGIRVLGLGGSMRYRPGHFQYSEREMHLRAARMKYALWRNKGFDVLLTHAPAQGINDGTDIAHRGFETFNELMDRYQPTFFVHGHVHMNYGRDVPRCTQRGSTTIINAFERYVFDIETPTIQLSKPGFARKK